MDHHTTETDQLHTHNSANPQNQRFCKCHFPFPAPGKGEDTHGSSTDPDMCEEYQGSSTGSDVYDQYPGIKHRS